MKSQLPFDSYRSFCIHVIIISLFSGLGTAQVKGTEQSVKQSGRPFIRNYAMKEYRSQQQNWAIAEDRQGLIMFGNGGGLMTFDGQNWELMKLPIARDMVMDSTGRIFMGMENNLGYLEPDPAGNYRFHSLKQLLPLEYQNLTPVFCVIDLNGKVIFQTNHYLFIYNNGQFKIIPAETEFRGAYKVRDRCFVRDTKTGILYLENDTLRLLEGSEILGEDRIYSMLPYGNEDILIITKENGSLVYSPRSSEKYIIPEGFGELNTFLAANWPYCGIVLPDGNYAVGTITAGVVVFSPDGTIRNVFDKKSGLYDNTVYDIYCDKNRNLWAALDNGISRIEYESPFVHYTEQEGLLGSVLFVKYFREQLYVGTGQYLHRLKPDGSFGIVPGTYGQSFDLMEAKNTLLLAQNPGVYEVRDNQTFLIPHSGRISATCFGILNSHPEYLLVGGDTGFGLIHYNGSSWEFKGFIKGFNIPVYSVWEDPTGFFWSSSQSSLYKLRFNEALDSVVYWEEYPAGRGLPHENGWPFRLNSGEVIFSTEAGIFRYVAEADSFIRHPDFQEINGKITSLLQQPEGDIWFEESMGNFTYHKGVLRLKNGKYEVFKTPFLKFKETNCNESPPNICVLPDGTVYFGTNMGLLKYLPEEDRGTSRSFVTLIRKVFMKDSLLFGGNSTEPELSGLKSGIEIPWGSNDVTFHYTATFYEDADKNQFSYRLAGQDSIWSNWTSDHKKEYTNLREGQYTFEVKSRNQYLEEGGIAAYHFTILAPWHRQWWAYLSYLLLASLIFYGLLQLRTRKLKLQRLALEKTVRERTNEIREQKNNIDKLSKIGRDITSSLSIENIIKMVYENVNTLMDASVFTIGLHKPEGKCLEFPAAIEKGELLPSFSIPLSDVNRLAVWCFNNRQEVVVNDYEKDYKKYVGYMAAPIAGESPESVLYLPLCSKDKAIGVISAQSFNKNAYTDYHLNMLRNLATYSAIALENADAYRQLSVLLEDLKTTQDRLVTQSKLAALGELTAGIAHEIQNPLNFVNNFSEISKELLDEMKMELDNGNQDDIREIANNLILNLEKINHHGKRADAIVKSMLQHSRTSVGIKEPIDINALCDEYLRLSYHGFRAKDKTFNAEYKTDFDPNLPKINVVPQDIGRVLLNLINNAFYAVSEVKTTHALSQPSPVKTLHETSRQPPDNPCVIVSTRKNSHTIEIRVKDNGPGIPAEVVDKIFQPFFTTKPTGQGTGLGLSISYDIVKAHGGEIKVESEEGEGTEFIIHLPYS